MSSVGGRYRAVDPHLLLRIFMSSILSEDTGLRSMQLAIYLHPDISTPCVH